MKKIFLISLIILLNLSSFSQQIKVAILDFENTSGIAKYDGLGKAMSSMLITDIEANVSAKRLQLVERTQIQKILKEQNFQSSSAVDKNTAVKAGKILGVKYLLVGDIYILNDVLVLNARLTDAETGNIKFSKKQEGKLSTWLMLKTNIAKELASSISMPFTVPNIPDQEINVATITTFGNAVMAKDEGKIEKAEELLKTLQEFSPDFKYVEDIQLQLEEIKKSLQNLQKTTDNINQKQDILLVEINKMQNINEELLKSLNPKAIYLSNELKVKINTQLADKDYKKYSELIIDPYTSFEKTEILKAADDEYINKLKELRQFVALKYPNTDIGYFSRAYFEGLKGNNTEAVALNDSATAVNPIFWLAYWKNGQILNDVEYYNKAIKANPIQSLLARENRGLYFLTNKLNDESYNLNQASNDFKECFKLTGQVFYKFLECGVYHDYKQWSELCSIVNSPYGEEIKKLKLFKENRSLYLPIFSICNQDTSVCNYGDILFDKTKYFGNKVILNLAFKGVNLSNSSKFQDKYYFSIECIQKKISKLSDFKEVGGYAVELYFNRNIFNGEFDKIRNLQEGELLTVIALPIDNGYNVIFNVVDLETGFKNFAQMNYPQKPRHELQKGGLIMANNLENDFIKCHNELYKNPNLKISKCIAEIGGLEKFYEYFSDNSFLLNNVSFLTAEKSNSKTELQLALKMIERACFIDFESTYNYLDTYAFVLLKNGRKEESLIKLNKAIQLAEVAGDKDAVTSYKNKLLNY
jgi:TolB-like protein